MNATGSRFAFLALSSIAIVSACAREPVGVPAQDVAASGVQLQKLVDETELPDPKKVDARAFAIRRIRKSGKFSPEFIVRLETLEDRNPKTGAPWWQGWNDSWMLNKYWNKERVKKNFKSRDNEAAIRAAEAFLAENEHAFDEAEERYGIPREAIASLFWIESCAGKCTGVVPVVEAYLAHAGSDHKDRIDAVMRALKKKAPQGELPYFQPSLYKMSDKSLREMLLARAKEKVKASLEQLLALDRLYQKDLKAGGASKRDVFSWRGSYAGAFGIGQFLPSSYERLAVGRTPGVAPDLFDPYDAILSTSHFLRKSGWKPMEKGSAEKALMSYNQMQVYGSTILDIYTQLVKRRKRAQN